MNYNGINNFYEKFSDKFKNENDYYTPQDIVQLLTDTLEKSKDILPYHDNLLIGTSLYYENISSDTAIMLERWDQDTNSITMCKTNPSLPEEAFDKVKFERIPLNGWENIGTQTKYDYIISNPPFGNNSDTKERLENSFVLRAVNSLKKGGLCSIIVPNGILGRELSKDIGLRKHLCENFHVISVLLLPLSIFSSAQVYTSILHIKNIETDYKKTLIYDLRDCIPSHNIYEHYKSSKPTQISLEELSRQKYSLLPEMYGASAKLSMDDFNNIRPVH